VTQYFTQLNSYHVVMEVLAEMQRPGTALDSIYVNSPTTGDAVPLSTFVKWTREPTNFLDQSPEHVPLGHPVLQPRIRYRAGSGVCMDWRHLEELPVAGHGEVKNLCVWVKDNAGMGSLSKTRVVRDGNVITAGGVISDIDVGLRRVV
jgi:hypothetical protein